MAMITSSSASTDVNLNVIVLDTKLVVRAPATTTIHILCDLAAQAYRRVTGLHATVRGFTNETGADYPLHHHANKITGTAVARAAAFRDTLRQGEALGEGHFLTSSSGNYVAVMQSDSNFMVYSSFHFSPKNALWSSNTSGKGPNPARIVVQEDANMAIYDGANKPIWASGTYGKGTKGYHLVMQDDGNLVLYDGSHSAIWSTNTGR